MRGVFHIHNEPIKAEPRHDSGRGDTGKAQPGSQRRFTTIKFFFHLIGTQSLLAFLTISLENLKYILLYCSMLDGLKLQNYFKRLKPRALLHAAKEW
jgi:hypothetical protein